MSDRSNSPLAPLYLERALSEQEIGFISNPNNVVSMSQVRQGQRVVFFDTHLIIALVPWPYTLPATARFYKASIVQDRPASHLPTQTFYWHWIRNLSENQNLQRLDGFRGQVRERISNGVLTGIPEEDDRFRNTEIELRDVRNPSATTIFRCMAPDERDSNRLSLH
jgi:hypothetical protein